jgi:hypothetical protein
MHNTHTTFRPEQPLANQSVESRLSTLLMENEREAIRSRLFRSALEEQEMLLMQRPISTEKAYALFGLLLGTFPPAAIFYRDFGGELTHPYFQLDWFFLLLAMNATCSFVGRRMGARVSRWLDDEENTSRTWKFFMSLTAGISWGVLTGAAGGLPFLGIGAIFGALYALPVGMLAFPLFASLHRPLARGGMIDARHFWPLACGVVMFITALILGL